MACLNLGSDFHVGDICCLRLLIFKALEQKNAFLDFNLEAVIFRKIYHSSAYKNSV